MQYLCTAKDSTKMLGLDSNNQPAGTGNRNYTIRQTNLMPRAQLYPRPTCQRA